MTITVLTYCCDLISTSELFKGKHNLFMSLEVPLAKVSIYSSPV